MASAPGFVIVGGGLAAATAAETLREEGFDGPIRVIAEEAELPYERPPLSKGYLSGNDERSVIFPHDAAWYGDRDVEVLTGVRASGLDPAAHRIAAGPDELRYDALLLATGAMPRSLDLPGVAAAGVHVLRTVGQSERLRDELSAGGRRVVIIGAGWIGLEVAAAARGYGNEVTIVGREEIPLAGALGDELGTMFRELHERNGVGFRMRTEPQSVETDSGRVTGVSVEGAVLPADVVVVAVGVVPDTGLAEQAGLELDNGVAVDERMRTSAADVLAAGDVASAYHPVLKSRMRNEHWANAIGGGKVAAFSMLGRDTAYDEIPYFFTDQYDLGMEYSGYPPLAAGADTIVYRGDRAAGEFIAFWQREGRIVAGMNVNVWDVNEAVQELIRSQRPVDAARLADPAIDLASV